MSFLTIIKSNVPTLIEEVHFRTGEFFEKVVNCPETALYHYEKAIAIKRNYAEAHYRIAKIKEFQGDIKGASDSLNYAFWNSQKDNPIIRENIVAYYRKFYYKRKRDLEVLIKNHKATAEEMVEFAYILTEKFGEYKLARKYLEQATNQINAPENVFFNSASLAQENFDEKTGHKYALKGVELFPESCLLNWIAGEHYEFIDDYKTAVVYYQKALSIDSELGLFLYGHMAGIYQYQLKMPEESKRYADLALEMNEKEKLSRNANTNEKH